MVPFISVHDGDVYFLTERILSSYIKNSSIHHRYIVNVSSDEMEKRYIKLFNSLNYTDYYISNEREKISLPCYLKLLIAVKKNKLTLREKNFLGEIYKYRKQKIVIHGNLFSSIFIYFLLFSFWKDINWICWGAFPDDYLKINSWKIASQLYFLKGVYQKFQRIICLMQPDVEKIKKKYHCKNVFLCPYPLNYVNINTDEPVISNGKILIGNSGHVAKAYLEFTNRLIPYSSLLDLTYMFPYGKEGVGKAKELLSNLLSEYKFTYQFWEDTLPYDTYLKKMCQYQFYVCPFTNQTGLGAIYTMIYQEKTVYLSGFNLAWLRFLNFEVFSIDDLLEKLQSGESLEMNAEAKRNNRNLLIKLFDAKHRVIQMNQLMNMPVNLCNQDSNWM